jgi:hypothetical protein
MEPAKIGHPLAKLTEIVPTCVMTVKVVIGIVLRHETFAAKEIAKEVRGIALRTPVPMIAREAVPTFAERETAEAMEIVPPTLVPMTAKAAIEVVVLMAVGASRLSRNCNDVMP